MSGKIQKLQRKPKENKPKKRKRKTRLSFWKKIGKGKEEERAKERERKRKCKEETKGGKERDGKDLPLA